MKGDGKVIEFLNKVLKKLGLPTVSGADLSPLRAA